MALRVYRVVVVGCPRCVLTGDTGKREGVGKSCFCNRFVRPDTFSLHHDSVFSEREWRNNSVYNGDHFIYWGAATKRLQDGTRARFQVVEQTEFYNINNENISFPAEEDYISRACSTHFISRGKVAYKLHSEEEYTIPSSLKHKGSLPSRATQLFPNNEFSEGKGVTGFICLFDPTLQGEDIKLQVDFLSKLIQELVKTKRRVILACTKCDEANEDRIQLGANLAATVIPKKPIPFVQTSAKEGVNIEDVFFHVVSPNKKRSFVRNGKNSPAGFLPTYSEVVLSRGHNETYAMNTFNRVIKENVQQFSTEWSDIWPLLQRNPACVQAVEVLGIEKARKVFCQRLMEIKVNEVRGTHPKTRKLDQQRTKNIQSELMEAFNGHPDLGSDCMYDFVYSPSPASTPRNGKSSSSDAPTPSVTPCNTPIKGSSVPDSSSGFFPKSPPPPPPTSSIPSLSLEGTPTRTALFSPTRTSQTLPLLAATKLNRSTELLAYLQKIDANIPRHSSLRYRNRTLPPLPTAEQFSPTKRLSNASLTKSQPQLDDSGSFTSSSTLDRQQRRLSSSMDCLLNEDILFEEDEVDCEVDKDASPYIEPVEIRKAMNKYYSDTERPVVSSMKLPRQRIHFPIPSDFLMDDHYRLARSKSCRDRSNTMPAIGSSPHLSTTPKPPLPPKSLTMRNESPLLAMTIASPGGGQTSLDFPSESVHNILSDSISPNILDSHKPADDTSSIASGPFAEIDDEQDKTSVGSIPHGEQQSSFSRTPDHPHFSATLPLRHRTLNRSLSPLPRGQDISPYITTSSTRTSPERENLYASIPADDEYLTMKPGVSLEELLSDSRKPRSTSVPTVQSVIKKLQFATRSESDANSSPARRKRGSDISVQSIKSTKSSSIVESVIEEDSPLLSLQRPSVVSVDRPLPPSPTKLRRVASNSGKHGDNNIYESIDENEEWFQQLKRERMLRHQQKMDQLVQISTELATNCNQIMEMFLASPEVQELWLNTVKSILPDFQPPTETTIQPLTVNPEYFISYIKSHSKAPVIITDTPVDQEDSHIDSDNKEDDKLLSSGHRKLEVTDSVVERMNQELQQKSSSSSESEGEDDDVELDNDDEENVLESPTFDWATLLNHGAGQTDSLGSEIGRALSIIHQKFNEKYINDDHLDISEGDNDSENDNFENNESEGEEHYASSDDEYVEGGISDMPALPYSSAYLASPATSSTHTVSPVHQLKQSSAGTPPLSATLSDNHNSSYVVQNGHLSVCQLNSLDSGISSK